MKFNPFGKDKKSKIEQKLEDACAADKERIEASITKAGAETDPASKVLKLRRVQTDIDDFLRQSEQAIADQAKRAGTKAGALGGSSVFAGGIALMLAPHLFIAGLAVCLFAPEAAGSLFKHKGAEKTQEKLEKIAAGHFKYLRDRKDDLTDQIEQVMTEHVPEITKSALNARIMQDYGLSEIFAHASAKHQAAEEAAAEKAEADAAKKVKKDNYGKLIGIMEPKKKSDPKPPTK